MSMYVRTMLLMAVLCQGLSVPMMSRWETIQVLIVVCVGVHVSMSIVE